MFRQGINTLTPAMQKRVFSMFVKSLPKRGAKDSQIDYPKQHESQIAEIKQRAQKEEEVPMGPLGETELYVTPGYRERHMLDVTKRQPARQNVYAGHAYNPPPQGYYDDIDAWWSDPIQKEYLYRDDAEWISSQECLLYTLYFFGFCAAFWEFYRHFSLPVRQINPLLATKLTQEEKDVARAAIEERKRLCEKYNVKYA
ncbi:alr [Acrasis kona]|uniref:Alr n=1 Tax=Acrasis kona TaxID=1008807 RepID=A0AAW2ZHI9_9EUKA